MLNAKCRGARSLPAILGTAILLFAASAANADDQVETVVVTGTLLHLKDTTSPVTILSREQISNAGITSVADVVRSVVADNSGTIPTAFGGGFAAGSSGVALRGLTVNSTLVLIDGRRTANYALADDGQRGFVDLNTIPLDVVSRVDVLKDGASSIYGADAIAGVVNIILDNTFTGEAGEVEAGTSEQGGGEMERATAKFGYGDLDSDHYNGYIDFEYETDQRISVAQRGFPFNTNNLTSIGGQNLNPQPDMPAGTIYGSVTPGILTTPGDVTTGQALTGAVSQPLRPCPPGTQSTDPSGNVYCAQDLALYGDDQPYETRFGVYSRFTFGINSDTTAYLSASYFQNFVTIHGGPQQIEAGTPNNTNAIALPATLPGGANNPQDPFAGAGYAALINYAFGDIPSSTVENNHVFRGVADIQGSLWGWDYDSTFVAAHTWLDGSLFGFIDYNQLITDVTDGTYNFLDPSQNSAATNAALSPTARKTSTTDMDSLDFQMNRDVFQLPGGPVGVGFGVSGRYEATNDPDLNPGGMYQGLGLAKTVGHHNVFSAYGEIGAPVVKTVEVDVSGRYDHYSDFGGNFSPKAGVKWTPDDHLMLRGTFSEGFRAPSFAENGQSASEGFISFTPPCSFIDEHGGNNCVGGDGYVQQYQLGLLSSANPKLRPETSDSFTLGSVVRPLGDDTLVASLDWYSIEKDHVITQDDPNTALNDYFGMLPIPPGYTIIFDKPDPLYPNAPLRPLVVSSPYINADSLKTKGLDLDVTLNQPLPYGLSYTGELNVTDILEYKFKFPGSDSFSYVGLQSPYILSSGAGTPRWRGSLANTLTYGDFSTTGTLYYTSGLREYGIDAFGPFAETPQFCIYDPPTGGPDNCRMKSFWDFDLTGRYKIDQHFELFGTIRNLFNAPPPVDPANYAGVNYNPTYSQEGIIGRFFSLGVRAKF